MAESLQPAYLLHARDYRDSSLIIELLTPEQGRISAVARGVKNQRRGFNPRAILQPFQPLWISVAGRAELKNLREVETRATAIFLQGRALFSGLYVNELLCRVLHRDDPHPDLFADYENVLSDLALATALDVALRKFELRLLDELGYGFSLISEADTDADIDSASHYYFDAQRGLIRAAGADNSRSVLSGRDILDFINGNYSENARRTMKWLCRLALRPHLGDKPLLSRQLFTGER